MSAILAVIASDGRPTDDALVARMLGRMGARAGAADGARAGVWREDGVVLAVSRYEWEFGADFSGPVLTVQDGDLVVVADASLYYKDDLRRKLAGKGVVPKGDTASHLILAAYRAFGERCPEQLEGDFSFIVWDRKEHRLLAARDFAGRRPLFHATLAGGKTFVVASDLGAIVEHPDCSGEFNLTAIAETIAGLFGTSPETCYRDILRFPAGMSMSRTSDRRTSVRQIWEVPCFDTGAERPDAADELRAVLQRATAERMSADALTTVWMSGGYDSTAVFGMARSELQNNRLNAAQRVEPVSISYPVGDVGREDEFIQTVADYWSSPVHWIDSENIPLFGSPKDAVERSEPFAHMYENWNRALAAKSESVGAHIALDGYGGDQVFQTSMVYLADLFRTGRCLALAENWRSAGNRLGRRSPRVFWSWAVRPFLSDRLVAAVTTARRGQRPSHYLDRPIAPWIDRTLVPRETLLQQRRFAVTRKRGESCSSLETRWYTSCPYFPAVISCVSNLALEHGVEVRSPLYDQRVIEFMARQNRSDRSSATETKRLLRRSVRDSLPAEVLAPRRDRTGTMEGYFRRMLPEKFPALAQKCLEHPLLGELGLVDVKIFDQACKALLAGHSQFAVPVLLSIQTEMWLRDRVNPRFAGYNNSSQERPSMVA